MFWRAVAVVAVALLLYIYGGGDPPRIIGPLNPEDPEKLAADEVKEVLIVGGGVAGLTAALELAEKGYHVTIKERHHILGGRLMTQKVEALGQTFHITTGFHGWFHNYHNTKDIRSRLKVNQFFVPWIENHFAFKKYHWEEIHSSGPWPLNLVGIVMRSPNLSILTSMMTCRVAWDFITYNHDTVYQHYDDMTFEEWAESVHVVPSFGDIWLRPGAAATFNDPKKLSAAEQLLYSHFFFISNAQANHREYTTTHFDQALIAPWKTKLEELGVKIELNTTVQSLVLDSKSSNVTGVTLNQEEKYDHVILALDYKAIKKIVEHTASANENKGIPSEALQKVKANLDHIPLAPPLKILRVWFDKQLMTDPVHPVLQTPGYPPVNLITQIHMLEEEYISWASQTGGSVMEFGLFTWSFPEMPSQQIWQIISASVKEIYPEIFEEKFKILFSFVQTFDNVASFEKGLEKYRPTSGFPQKCGIPNLSFAGDWLHTDYPSALLERAVSTGKEAANHVLLSNSVRQIPLTVTSSYGPGVI